MNKPLLGSIVVATLLLGDASAATVYERFEMMEKEMQGLQTELADLKAERAAAEEAAAKAAEEEPEEEDEAEKSEDEEAEEGEEEEDISEVLEEMEESITEINKATSGNHLKLDVDFRTSYDYLNYEMADGTRIENKSILTNRLWLNMNWAASKNMSFTGQLAYNKTYGQRSGVSDMFAQVENFDWIGNENPNADSSLHVKSAYWFYRNDTFLGGDTPWTISIGRRPSTNGHLINLRDNDVAASPSGHTINVEFDGISSKFNFEKLTGVEGMYVKFCAGQGGTNAEGKFAPAPFTPNDTQNENIYLAGLIFVPYDNGQFSIGTQFYGANNLIGGATPMAVEPTTVGNIYSGSIYMITNGIGNEWADFLDDTTFFVSGAMSRTDPDDGLAMLGSPDMENGYSYWAGLNMPSLFSDEGRFGLEFNHGSRYWRPITYGEDTMIGSKVAARGDAYEVYFTEPLLEEFSFQVRYTYIDYAYAGSNGFFGNRLGGGAAVSIEEAAAMALPPAMGGGTLGQYVVDKAQDVRVYLRYRF